MEGNEEIQQLITEIMSFYSDSSWVYEEHLEYIRTFIGKCWQALGKQDEISYATSGIIETIINYQKDEDKVALIYPEGFDYNYYFSKLLRFFHHNLAIVRKNIYYLIVSFLNFDFAMISDGNNETLQKLAILSLQNLMIEEQKVTNFYKQNLNLNTGTNRIIEYYQHPIYRVLLQE